MRVTPPITPSLFLFALVPLPRADTLDVPGEFPSIQAAVDAAASGDTVLVAPGTYDEHVVVDGKTVHLLSAAGAGVTTIRSQLTGRPVTFQGGAGGTLEGFTLTEGRAGKGGGLACLAGAAVLVRFNTIADCESDFDGGGVFALDAAVTLEKNVVELNRSLFGHGAGIYLEGDDPVVLSGNTVRDNVCVSIEVRGGGIYCDAPGAELVGNTVERNDSYEGGGAALLGDDAVLLDNTWAENEALLAGGGLWIEGRGARLENETLRDNDAILDAGGGVFASGDGLELLGCELRGNRAENFGALSASGAQIVLDGCLVEDNENGAVAIRGGSAYVADSRFEGNSSSFWEAALTFREGGVGFVERCVFAGNTADASAAGLRLLDGAQVVLRDSLVAGNASLVQPSRGDGGGVYVEESTLLVERCTLTANEAFLPLGGTLGGGGIHVAAGSAVCQVRDSIVFGNAAFGGTAPEIYDGAGGVTVATSDVGGGWPGAGNLDADPEFAAPDGVPPDYRLTAGSPCVDAADPASLPLTTDLGGRPRVSDGDLDGLPVLDMGAYELGRTELVATGDGTPGTALVLDVTGPSGWLGVLLLANEPGAFYAPPFGVYLFAPGSFLSCPYGIFALPAQFAPLVPVDVAGTFVLQAVGADPVQVVGDASGSVALDL